ncbi:MAG: DNA transfer protein, partial [Plesiomonas sp.]
GGLGSTSTGNALASIAPQLGMSYLGQREAQQADLFNRLMAGAGMGLNAAAQQGQAGQNYVSQASNAFNQAGAAQAGGAMSGFNTLLGLGGTFIGAGGLPGLSKLF